MLMLLGVCISSIIAIAYVGYDNGRQALYNSIQLSTDEINNVMTGGNDWEGEGLGKSGETYLVGADYGMRSNSRFLIEQPEAYFKAVTAEGLSETELAYIKLFNSSILHQPVDTEAIQQAFDNQTGFAIGEDYRGVKVLNAYRPLEINDLDWVINANISEKSTRLRQEIGMVIESRRKAIAFT